MELAHIRAALRRAGRRVGVRLRRGLSMGIAGRLATSFAAVAVLAVAANVVIEREIAVVETTRVDRGQYSPIPEAPPGGSGRAAVEAAHASTHSPVMGAQIERFQAARDRYQRSIETRASMDTAAAESDLHAAGQELELTVRVLAKDEAVNAGDVQDALSQYEGAGMDYVHSVAARRTALQQYQDRLDAMDQRITVSMDGALKIFGRVFARQSLLRLHSKVDDLQRRFTDVAAASVADPHALDNLIAGEDALAHAFAASETSLSRSEGTQWAHRMREDISRLAPLRAAGVATSRAARDSLAKLVATHGQLVAAIPAPVSETAWASEHAAAPRRVPALPPAIASPVVGEVTTTTTTMSTVPDHDRRMAVAWITAAVLLVWIAISIWTVRSILIPVGRLIEATRKLSSGEDVRAPRGGMKELNALAAAFNRMAIQLRVARKITQDYRQTLETQVEQRTRLLQHLAEHDPLTLLANRRQFFVLLNRSLERARRRASGIAVFFIDLDNFKNLNDGMGHAFGDRVLISVAQRLEETAHASGFAARLGGDEFTVVHERIDSSQAALAAGRRIVDAFIRPLSVEGREVTVSVSVGASLYPDHDDRAEHLLSAADAALFRAKALGRNQVALFTPELLEMATRKFTTEQGIRRALELEEFELVFQPEVSMQSLKVGLVEALVRWRHARRTARDVPKSSCR